MKISKEEKEVMGVLEDLVSSTLADSDGCLLFKTDYDEPLDAIHKIYKPLLDEKDKSIDNLNMECRAREIDNHDLKTEIESWEEFHKNTINNMTY